MCVQASVCCRGCVARSSAVPLLRDVCCAAAGLGFHLMYDGDTPHDNVSRWNVTILKVRPLLPPPFVRPPVTRPLYVP